MRPGRPTAEFLDRILARLTFPGALYLAAVAALPTILINQTSANFFFGGTSILIVDRRRARHDEAARGADDDAQLRGLPEVDAPGGVGALAADTLPRLMASQLNLILLGPPGAGKGTQAERLVEDFDLPYYATGDILRKAVKDGTELGKKAKEYMDRGDLVPDDVICGVVMERVDSAEAEDGFLLDGFPRTLEQAEVLERALEKRDRKLTAALLIDAPDEEVVQAALGPADLREERHLYHVEFDPPKNEGVCDQDGSKLIQRDDDKPETVKHRLERLPRADRSADRALRRAEHAPALRREPPAGRGARPHPRDSGHAQARGRALT